jgi:hypothetical protein
MRVRFDLGLKPHIAHANLGASKDERPDGAYESIQAVVGSLRQRYPLV